MKTLSVGEYQKVMRELRSTCESVQPTEAEIALAFFEYGVKMAEAEEAEKAEKQPKRKPQ